VRSSDSVQPNTFDLAFITHELRCISYYTVRYAIIWSCRVVVNFVSGVSSRDPPIHPALPPPNLISVSHCILIKVLFSVQLHQKYLRLQQWPHWL